MKTTYTKLLTGLLLCFAISCDTLQPIAGSFPGTTTTTTSSTGTPTGGEISSALKQALEIGIKQGVKQVSAKNGFFDNALIKILFPPQAQKVESTLRQVGLGSLCDKVVLSLNRAAEDASKQATPIFINALKNMSFQDASRILMGADTSATHYFRAATTSQLTQAFKPVITKSLSQVDATHYWGTVMTQYNRIPLVKPVNTDLNDYVTQKAIDGLFQMVAKKEIQIRENIAGRNTALMKKVFSYADRKK